MNFKKYSMTIMVLCIITISLNFAGSTGQLTADEMNGIINARSNSNTCYHHRANI